MREGLRCLSENIMIIKVLLLLMIGTTLVFANPGVRVGDKVPLFSGTDIDGMEVNLKAYLDRVLIISIANRDSYKRLTAMMKHANIEILKKRPDLNMVFVSFADLSAVPRLFKPIAHRVIHNLNVDTKRELDLLYKEASLNLRRGQTVSHIIPDWEGIGWAQMGVDVEDREIYRFWVVKNGSVIAMFHEGMKNISVCYMDSILNNFEVRF